MSAMSSDDDTESEDYLARKGREVDTALTRAVSSMEPLPLPDAILQLQFVDYRNAELTGPVSSATMNIPLSRQADAVSGAVTWRTDSRARDVARGPGVNYRQHFGGKTAMWHTPDARMTLDDTPQRPGRDRDRNLVLDRKFQLTKCRFFVRKSSVPYTSTTTCERMRHRDPYELLSAQSIRDLPKQHGWWSKIRRIAQRGVALTAATAIGALSLDPGLGVEQMKAMTSPWDQPLLLPTVPGAMSPTHRLCPRPACEGDDCTAGQWFDAGYAARGEYCRMALPAATAAAAGDSGGDCLAHEDVYLPFSIVVDGLSIPSAASAPSATSGDLERASAVLFGLIQLMPADHVLPGNGKSRLTLAEIVRVDVNETFLVTTDRQASVQACRMASECMLFETR